MINSNTKEYWDTSWLAGKKKFPKYTTRKIIELVPDKSSVLDIGCGHGKILRLLKSGKNCEVYGIDISSVAIEMMRKAGVEGEVCNAEDLVLKTGKKFDVIIASHILEHLDNDEEFVSRCSKLLNPNGFMIVAVPDKCSPPEEEVEHVRMYDENSLMTLMLKDFYKIEDCSIKNHLIFKACL